MSTDRHPDSKKPKKDTSEDIYYKNPGYRYKTELENIVAKWHMINKSFNSIIYNDNGDIVSLEGVGEDIASAFDSLTDKGKEMYIRIQIIYREFINFWRKHNQEFLLSPTDDDLLSSMYMYFWENTPEGQRTNVWRDYFHSQDANIGTITEVFKQIKEYPGNVWTFAQDTTKQELTIITNATSDEKNQHRKTHKYTGESLNPLTNPQIILELKKRYKIPKEARYISYEACQYYLLTMLENYQPYNSYPVNDISRAIIGLGADAKSSATHEEITINGERTQITRYNPVGKGLEQLVLSAPGNMLEDIRNIDLYHLLIYAMKKARVQRDNAVCITIDDYMELTGLTQRQKATQKLSDLYDALLSTIIKGLIIKAPGTPQKRGKKKKEEPEPETIELDINLLEARGKPTKGAKGKPFTIYLYFSQMVYDAILANPSYAMLPIENVAKIGNTTAKTIITLFYNQRSRDTHKDKTKLRIDKMLAYLDLPLIEDTGKKDAPIRIIQPFFRAFDILKDEGQIKNYTITLNSQAVKKVSGYDEFIKTCIVVEWPKDNYPIKEKEEQ